MKNLIKKPLKQIYRALRLFIQKMTATKNLDRYTKINLCSGSRKIPKYCNIDISEDADIIVDLEKYLLPLSDNSCDIIICMSAINYFSKDRAYEIIKDVYRVLKLNGITRFGTQDLRILAQKYINQDRKFFFETLPNGQERYEGNTMCDKFNAWFYGYKISCGKHCRYVYDFETIALLFQKAGFRSVEEKNYRESAISDIQFIDNRPNQMFYLEAIK